MNLSSRTLRILKGESPLPLYFLCLAPFAWVYSLFVMARAALYRAGALKPRALPCKVISVGNLTAGGTGKTPMVVFLASLLHERGQRVAVLTRGYGGRMEGRVAAVSDGKDMLLSAEEAGDEAALLARSLPGVPVIMGSDRYKAGLFAAGSFRPDVVILDDGYQRLGLKRDLNILLMDAARPFGNGHTLPMGYLREPECAINRADMVVLTRADLAEDKGEGETAVSKLSPGLPVIKAAHKARRLRELSGGREMGLETLAGRKVLAVAGIADPASFTLILQKLNAKINGTFYYPDHHRYTQDDLVGIEAEAARVSAEFAVTTEKDSVKLAGLSPCALEFLVLGVELVITSGGKVLEDRLAGEIA